ncbi:MAG: MoaD/ThiS family protein [Verrucomicrobiae bacterium]|nr:MoaD/ThiS family protein [Verrucomicrobiae bacterium]
MVRLLIPPTLRRLCGGEETLQLPARSVGELIGQLHGRFNGVRDRLCDGQGRIRGSVLVYVNDEDIRFLQSQGTPLKPGDEVSILPAYAGG